jgi:hypothetical protein
MPTMCPLDPWRVICPLRARGPTPAGPPTAWSVPVTVPVGPEGPLGDEQPANDTEATRTGSRASNGQGLSTHGLPSFACSWTTCSNETVSEAHPAVTATHFGDISLVHAVRTRCCLLTLRFTPHDFGPARQSLRCQASRVVTDQYVKSASASARTRKIPDSTP